MSEDAETMVRMGELAVSDAAGHVLASIGLGSCIGLVMLESRRAIAGLAHIVVPESTGAPQSPPGKFADTAVPELIERMRLAGAPRWALRAVLVGGAQMFSFNSASRLDIGRRNEEATRAALEAAGIEVCAADTGGTQGRTVRVYVGDGRVTVRGPGGAEQEVFASGEPVGALG